MGDCFFFHLFFFFFFIYQILRRSFKAGTVCLAMLVAPEYLVKALKIEIGFEYEFLKISGVVEGYSMEKIDQNSEI